MTYIPLLTAASPSRRARRSERGRKRGARTERQSLGVEGLESRCLLAVSTIGIRTSVLNYLIAQAYQGKDTAPAAIRLFESSLQSQLKSGPLAGLQAGTLSSDAFGAAVAGLVKTYQATADQELLPRFPNVDNIIKLQGTKVESEIKALVILFDSGAISSSKVLANDAATAINGLTHGPLYALYTPLSGFVTTTKTLESSLNTLASSLAGAATEPELVSLAQTIGAAEVQAYSDAISASLAVTHPFVNGQIQAAVTTLDTAIKNLSTAADPQTALTDAIAVFNNAAYDTNGVFGPAGLVVQLRRRYS
jgi:hypothetical protein